MVKVNYQSSPEPEPSKKYIQVKEIPVDYQNHLQRETTAKRNSLYMCTDDYSNLFLQPGHQFQQSCHRFLILGKILLYVWLHPWDVQVKSEKIIVDVSSSTIDIGLIVNNITKWFFSVYQKGHIKFKGASITYIVFFC